MTVENSGHWARVDQVMCVGCGLCGDIAPTVFQSGDDIPTVVHLNGTSQPFGRFVLSNELGLAKDAAKECPTEAISVQDFSPTTH